MILQRAFSLLSVKDVDDKKRIITGIASTPTPDRTDDVVEPLGAKFALPMPLLLYHQSQMPVGQVNFAKPGKSGIPFSASLPNVIEPGVVQDRVNEAFHSLKYLLIGAVSIGFRALEGGVELLKTGGLRFTAWEWLELSLVAIPAQPEAVIQSFKSMDIAQIHRVLGTHPSDSQSARESLIESLRAGQASATDAEVKTIKSIDKAQLAATGQLKLRGAVRLVPSPGVSGKTTAASRGSVQLIPRIKP